MKTIASIWGENMLGYLSLDIICSSKLEENCELRGTDNVQGQITEDVFAPNCDYCLFIMHQTVLLALDWSKCVRWLNTCQHKLGNDRVIFPNFQTRASEVKDNDLSLHLNLARKYTRIFLLLYYLLLDAHSFPRAALSENSSLLVKKNIMSANKLI